MNESELVESVVKYFSRWFDIRAEVWDDLKVGRIDLVMEDRVTGALFGVECKHPEERRGKEIGDIVSQCTQYSRLNFNGKRIPVFLCPALSQNKFCYADDRKLINGEEWVKDKHDTQHIHHSFNSFLKNFNFGEIRKKLDHLDKPYYEFMYNNQRIYSTRKLWQSDDIQGLEKENYAMMLRNINQWEKQSRIFRISKP